MKPAKNKETDLLQYVRERPKLLAAACGAAVLLAALLFLTGSRGEGLRYGEDGTVIAVDLSEGGGAGIPLIVKAERGETALEKAATIRPESGKTEKETRYERSEEDLLRAELDRTIRALNARAAANGVVALPASLEDGTLLRWSEPKRGKEWLLPLLLIPLVPAYQYSGEKEKRKKAAARTRTEVVRALPGFTDQLYLFLSCGMVFEDAFARIAALRGEGSGKDAFGRMLAESREEAAKTGGDPLVLIARKGAAAKIKELSRLTALIMENRYSGADLRQKLRTEGEAMWNERLKQAQEQGKLAETRLSFPLSVMLVVLIGITAVPAMLQM